MILGGTLRSKLSRPIALTGCLATLFGQAAQAEQPMPITPEFGAAEPVYRNDGAYQRYPSVAFNGSVFLTTWTDERYAYPGGVFAARVDVNGDILDPAGIMLDVNAEDSSPAVASAGSNFLVVWDSSRSRSGVVGALIDQSGRIVKGSFPIFSGGAGEVGVAYDGHSYLVVWDYPDRSGAYDILASRVSNTGEVLDSPPIIVSNAPGDQHSPSVAGTDGQFLVVWGSFRSDQQDIYGARVTSDGALLDPAAISLATTEDGEYEPSVAASASTYLVAWEVFEVEYYQVEVARLSTEGLLLDPDGIDVTTYANNSNASIAFDGTGFMLVWSNFRGPSNQAVHAARITLDGSVEFTHAVVAEDRAGAPSIAWGSKSFLVAWVDSRSGQNDPDIYARRIGSDGSLLDGNGFLLIRVANQQSNPAVAWNGSIYLVAWEDDRLVQDKDIFVSRVSSDGTMLDGTGIPVSLAAGDQGGPAVASVGSDFLVVWNDRSTGAVHSAIVTGDGSVGVVQVLSEEARRDVDPAVASDGNLFMVVWNESYSHVFGARVNAAGTVLDEGGFPIVAESLGDGGPGIAWGGSLFLVVWPGNQPGIPYESDIRAARVNAAGEVLDLAGIDVSVAESRQTSPMVAAHDDLFMVVWEDYRDGYCEYGDCLPGDVYANRVRADGVVLDGDGIIASSTSTVSEFRPDVVWHGALFLVGWESYPDSSCQWRSTIECANGDVRGARVSVSGVVRDRRPRDLATGTKGEAFHDLTVGHEGVAVLTYERRGESGIHGGALRAFLRFVSLAPGDLGGQV